MHFGTSKKILLYTRVCACILCACVCVCAYMGVCVYACGCVCVFMCASEIVLFGARLTFEGFL